MGFGLINRKERKIRNRMMHHEGTKDRKVLEN